MPTLLLISSFFSIILTFPVGIPLEKQTAEEFSFYTMQTLVSVRSWYFKDAKLLAKNQHNQKNLFKKKSFDELQSVKKCQNCTFKLNFLFQKSTEFKKKSSRNINLGDHFLVNGILLPKFF